jgi:predicted DsbA family dithiol-disulfide isomerase
MIQVEIWSDVVCPFCFIGKKNFEAALKKYSGSEKIEVVWRSFELDPKAQKSQQIKIHDLIAKKYGRTAEWAQENNERLTAQGKTIGIDFDFNSIIPTNSFDAHRLMHFARAENKENEVAQLLFGAYFSQGQDIAQALVLADIVVKVGLNVDNWNQILQGQDFANEVRNEESQAQELGISGVPAFVFNRKYLVSGAQPVEAFLEVLNESEKS